MDANRDKKPERSDWLTPVEAADYLKLTRRALEQRRSQRRGPRYYKVSSRIVRYRRGDLDRWLEAGAR